MCGRQSPGLTVTAVYKLSEDGRKASLLAGGNGQALQRVTVQAAAGATDTTVGAGVVVALVNNALATGAQVVDFGASATSATVIAMSHRAVPRPAGWGGFRVSPAAFEFWQGRENRLLNRLAYTLASEGWRRARLAP